MKAQIRPSALALTASTQPDTPRRKRPPPIKGTSKRGDLVLSVQVTADNMEALPEALGGVSEILADYLLHQMLSLTLRRSELKDGELDLTRLNAMLEIAAAVEPQDAVEAALATQMAALHHLAMNCARLATASETLEQHTAHINSVAKLLRAFTLHLEALDRRRGKGPVQRFVVENIHVNGQAVVAGVITKGAGAANETGERAHGRSHESAPADGAEECRRSPALSGP